MKIATLEIVVQLLIVFISLITLSYGMMFLKESGALYNSFVCYYEAARGNFISCFIYKHFTAVLFKWLLLFNRDTAYLVWGFVSMCSFMALSHLLFKVKYGWFIVLASLPIYKIVLQSGNITTIFTLAMVSPLTVLLAVLVKPHWALFALVVALAKRLELRNE